MKIAALLLTASLLCTCGDTRAYDGVLYGATPPPLLRDVVDRTMPSVVAITVELRADAFIFAYRPRSLGSGVIVDAARGIILTNAHVVDGLSLLQEVTVALHDGHFLPATVIGADKGADIAVLQVPTGIAPLVAMPRGELAGLKVGDPVLALGNPFGLGHTATAGVVSALHQVIGLNEFEDFIQIDAPINPGNSGGALVNLDGELLGINSAGMSGGGGGIGFAIPADLAFYVAEQLKAGRKSWNLKMDRIGMQVRDVGNEQERRRLGIRNRFGVLVTSVVPMSPADVAGLETGDVLLTVGDVPAMSTFHVGHRIATTMGRPVDLQILRAGVVHTLTVAARKT